MTQPLHRFHVRNGTTLTTSLGVWIDIYIANESWDRDAPMRIAFMDTVPSPRGGCVVDQFDLYSGGHAYALGYKVARDGDYVSLYKMDDLEVLSDVVQKAMER